MANVVELRDMDNEKLEEMLENARTEMFNLRFQHAQSRLTDTARIRTVRREIAQLQTVLNMRSQAVSAAAEFEPIAQALDGQAWAADARYVYEDGAYKVRFTDNNGREIASADVDLNSRQPKTRREVRSAVAVEKVRAFSVN